MIAVPHLAHAALLVSAAWSNVASKVSDFHPGDRLERAVDEAHHDVELKACSTWRVLEVQSLPLGPVIIIGTRSGHPHRWVVAEASVKLALRSEGKNEQAALVCSLREALDRHDLERAKSLIAVIELTDGGNIDLEYRPWLFLDATEYELAKYESAKALAYIDAAEALRVPSELLALELKIRRAVALYDAHKKQEATPVASEAVKRLEVMAPKSVAYGRALTILAQVNSSEALKTIDLSINVLQSACGRCVELADALAAKDDILSKSFERDEESLQLAWDTLHILEKIEPLDIRKVAQRRLDLAGIATRIGDYSLAEASIRRAQGMMRTVPVSGRELARGRGMLAVVLMDLGKYREALPENKAYVEIITRQGSPAQLGMAKNNLGLNLSALGDVQAAEGEFVSAIALAEPGERSQVRAHNNLGNALVQSGAYEQAQMSCAKPLR
jgi:tetratricopeptide (TPR) repeat protein